MATYPAGVDVQTMELTPCIVKFKKPGDVNYTDLGGTLGNVKVKVKYDLADIKADQFGTTVLDKKVSGFMCTVETELTQVKDISLLKVIFPHATFEPTGTTRLDFNTNVGDAQSLSAGELILHPQSAGALDISHDWTFWKVVATAESEINFSPTEQQKCKIVWQAYPDLSVSPARFASYGDTTI